MSSNIPAGLILNVTENHPACRIFTLHAHMLGPGSLSPVSVLTDMRVEIQGNGLGSTHNYQIQVYNGAPHTTQGMLEFEWKHIVGWVPNGIAIPSFVSITSALPTILTNSLSILELNIKRTQNAIPGIQPITVKFDHGNLSLLCYHKIELKIGI